MNITQACQTQISPEDEKTVRMFTDKLLEIRNGDTGIGYIEVSISDTMIRIKGGSSNEVRLPPKKKAV